MFYKILITVVMAAMLVTSANAQTITPTGLSQGDLVALLQNIVNALGSGVGSTYLTASPASAPATMVLNGASTINFDIAGAIKGIINSSGNLTLGATDLASTTSKLFINGGATASSSMTLSNHTTTSYGATLNSSTVGNYYYPLNFYGLASNGSSGSLGGIGVIHKDNTVGAMKSEVQFSTGAGVYMIANSSNGVTLGAMDLASTTSKLYVNGIQKISGTVAAAAITNPVLQVQFYDETGDATMTLPTAPAAGHVNVFAVKTSGGGHYLRLQMPDNSTAEVSL